MPGCEPVVEFDQEDGFAEIGYADIDRNVADLVDVDIAAAALGAAETADIRDVAVLAADDAVDAVEVADCTAGRNRTADHCRQSEDAEVTRQLTMASTATKTTAGMQAPLDGRMQ